ncbi:MAG: flippase-like domain-containing protein [Gemmatimonadetes bacterium]|nr:flippase-like domain-containing protein [Gemmatimonadota bacterium]
MRGHAWKSVFGLALTVLLLWWVLRDVSVPEVWQRVREADPWLLTGAVVAATFSFVLRALRWRVLLEPSHPDSRFVPRFGATCIGFAVNNLLPARLGEFARAYALSRTEGMNIGVSLASLVAERVFDGLVLAFFLFATISLPGFPLGEGSTALLVRRTANIGAIAFVLAFFLLWLAARNSDRSVLLFERTIGRLLSPALSERATHLAAGFLSGLGALHDTVTFAKALGWSVVVWLNLSISIWLGLLAFDITGPGLTGAIFLQSVIAFAVAAPSSPGFFGVFEAATRLGLGVYDVPVTDMVSFATSYHILTFLPVTILGLWYIRHFGLSWSEMGRSEETVEAALDDD